jgi:hypothetical protein
LFPARAVLEQRSRGRHHDAHPFIGSSTDIHQDHRTFCPSKLTSRSPAKVCEVPSSGPGGEAVATALADRWSRGACGRQDRTWRHTAVPASSHFIVASGIDATGWSVPPGVGTGPVDDRVRRSAFGVRRSDAKRTRRGKRRCRVAKPSWQTTVAQQDRHATDDHARRLERWIIVGDLGSRDCRAR